MRRPREACVIDEFEQPFGELLVWRVRGNVVRSQQHVRLFHALTDRPDAPYHRGGGPGARRRGIHERFVPAVADDDRLFDCRVRCRARDDGQRVVM